MSKEEKEIPGNPMNIELPPDLADGVYSNLAVISHSSSEFFLDFIRMVPGVPSAKVKSRIIMTPQHFKRLMLAIQDNLEKYETNFGVIEISNEPPIPPVNLGGPMGLA
jgi:hypothetical protein